MARENDRQWRNTINDCIVNAIAKWQLHVKKQVARCLYFAANFLLLWFGQISDYSGDKHQTSIDVLNAVGNVHWVGVGFLLVAAVLEIMDTIKNNKMERLRILNSMNDLAKVIMRLQPLPRLNEEMQAKMKDSIHLIVYGAILCCSQKKSGKLGRTEPKMAQSQVA